MSVPVPTEQTVTSILKELLRNKVKTAPEVSIETPLGRRLQPDLFIQNGGNYVVQAKLGDEAKTIDAMGQVYDCIRYLGVIGGFAVIYPEELRKPMPTVALEKLALETKHRVIGIFSDHRPGVLSFSGTLPDIADWIAQHVLKPPEYIEPDVDFSIRALRNAAQYVTAYLQYLKEEDLEDIFGGKTVFENILQYEEGKYPLAEMRQATAYLLINQLLFYNVLSSVDPITYPQIDEDKLRTPKDLLRYFNRVLSVNYSATFGFDVVSRVPDKAIQEVREVTKVIKALAPEKIRHDILGQLFHKVIPFETRKAVAAFYTNVNIAEMLARLIVEKADDKAIDLAIGSGGLIAAVHRAKRALLEEFGEKFDLEDHRKFVEEDLTGIDIMPFVAHLAAINLSLQAPVYKTERVRIAVWDSTELKPGRVIPAISKELARAYRQPTLEMFVEGSPNFVEEAYIEKGVVTMEGIGGEQIQLEQADIIIMNPPFTRQQRIPTDYKQALKNRFSDYSKYLHGQMGYHGYFMILADRFLKDGGRLALVLPASVLNADGFLRIRKLLTSRYHIQHIITTWQRAAFSEGAQFREILLVAKKVQVPDEFTCAVTELKKLPQNLDEARGFALKIKDIAKKKGLGVIFDDETMQVSLLTMRDLRKSMGNLFKFIAFTDKKLLELWNWIVNNAGDRLVKLGEYVDQYGSGPKEGMALGQVLKGGGVGALYVHKAPTRALKKTDVWILKNVERSQIMVGHKVLGSSTKIPLNALRPAMRRFSGVNTLDVSDELDYIIANKFSGIEKFLRLGFGKDVNAQFLKRWSNYVDNLLGNLLLANHADVSAPGTSILAYYSPTPTLVPRSMWSIKLPDSAARVFSLWLNSTPGLFQILLLRRETRGAYIWLVASTIREFMVPNLDKMSAESVQLLLRTFDEVRGINFPSIVEQLKNKHPQRVKIDKAIFRTLGFADEKVDELLSCLYPALTKEIETLKGLMEG